ncbi:hypothetical protein [Lentibacillus juripiscarius]|uniref:Endolytic transglycosylase MltG n=1 Tax=Lentibacillus juripiscarius TaxID=257446 RepID=A0ABW5V1W7_9BACI
MKQLIRSFALGLLTAGIILLATFYFSGSGQNNSELSTEDMIKKVESKGYHVMTESEYISVSVQSDQNKNEETDSDQKNKGEETASSTNKNEKSQSEEKNSNNDDDEGEQTSEDSQPTTYTLTIESGTPPSTISETLQENNIIESADEFTQYLEDKSYTKYVQLGEFELTSDMSHYEIAEAITN